MRTQRFDLDPVRIRRKKGSEGDDVRDALHWWRERDVRGPGILNMTDCLSLRDADLGHSVWDPLLVPRSESTPNGLQQRPMYVSSNQILAVNTVRSS